MELSRPTVRGSTAWGNRTVSRTGNTGTRRTGVTFLMDGFDGVGGTGSWFGIECPRINFPSLDNAAHEKFQECGYRPLRPDVPALNPVCIEIRLDRFSGSPDLVVLVLPCAEDKFFESLFPRISEIGALSSKNKV